MVRREAAGKAPEAAASSPDPADWPLAKLQAQMAQAEKPWPGAKSDPNRVEIT
jgi:hypothetical protein